MVIRVGVVGATLSGGWGLQAHLPALSQLPEYELTAVATRSLESARDCASAWSIPLAFGSADELIDHPDIDLVVAAVKSAQHAIIVDRAIAAGKHIYCEWPLGMNLAETRRLAQAAQDRGIVHAVGLQGLHSAGARWVRTLIRSGQIGELRSISASAAGGIGGTRYPQSSKWAADPAKGTTILTIRTAHVLSALAMALGDTLSELSALVVQLDPEATVIETGERFAVGSPDQVAIMGTLSNGALVSVAVQGGRPRAEPSFNIEIVGTDGAISVSPGGPGASPHVAPWHVLFKPAIGEPKELHVPDGYDALPKSIPAGPAANVAALHREVGKAIAEGRQPWPSFTNAVEHRAFIDEVDEAARTGQRVKIASRLTSFPQD